MARGRRQLRGDKLKAAILAELGRMSNLSPKTDPISISSLADRLKVSRQSIYSNKFKPLVDEFAELQRSNYNQNIEVGIKRKPLEKRIEDLEKENADLKARLDNYIERWVAIEYNARMMGINADDLFVVAPKPLRSIRRK
ncbi:hypothetical protein [Desulfovibrio gilichinskyi]|uniref:Uncharacterized protein n=1 Tax=Desulfovibrio gilichinskyi TaxID=1519643 RepID=A0A1X7DSI9_9BACT|nr:hypothetical protein [Desulfovibrio gilichinskyi]SMF20797.1 hypothetical protein SAMN06295933_2296 [Desulfovibrio gilichinskyi]